MNIVADFSYGETNVYTKSVYQYDKGLNLVFEGIEIPEGCEVHFSNERDGSGVAVYYPIKKDENIRIPDELLMTGRYVYAWVCATSESSGRETIYSVIIPVIARPVSIPVNGSSSSGTFDYELDVDDENLIIHGGINGLHYDTEDD